MAEQPSRKRRIVRGAGLTIGAVVLLVSVYVSSIMTLNFRFGAGWISYSETGRMYCAPYTWYTQNDLPGSWLLGGGMNRAIAAGKRCRTFLD